MNTEDIKKLIEILEKSTLEEMVYKSSDFELTLKKPSNVQTMDHIYYQQPQQVQVNAAPVSEPETAPQKEIQAPLVGVFYDRPATDAPSFVKVGDRVEVGDVLCIVEAMKVMNEIKSDQAGVVSRVCVGNGEAVAFGDVLFTLS